MVICGMTTFLLDFTFTSGFSRGKKTPTKLVSLWEIASVKQASAVGPGVRFMVQEKETAESSPDRWCASTPPSRQRAGEPPAQVGGQREAAKAGLPAPQLKVQGHNLQRVQGQGPALCPELISQNAAEMRFSF